MPGRYDAHELLVCDRCGAILALGEYSPLSRQGSFDCMADLRTIPTAEADKMLADYLAGRRVLAEQEERK